jgi:hypothetical protein
MMQGGMDDVGFIKSKKGGIPPLVFVTVIRPLRAVFRHYII